MSTITIPLPDEDFQFLSDWTRQQRTTVAEFFAREARNLRQHLQAPLHPDLKRAAGILAADLERESAHLNHLDRKHA
ncbi:MAG: hypothetical protein ABL974_18300 [Prosthecobacter sp.]